MGLVVLTWSYVVGVASAGAGDGFAGFEDENVGGVGAVLDQAESCQGA